VYQIGEIFTIKQNTAPKKWKKWSTWTPCSGGGIKSFKKRNFDKTCHVI